MERPLQHALQDNFLRDLQESKTLVAKAIQAARLEGYAFTCYELIWHISGLINPNNFPK